MHQRAQALEEQASQLCKECTELSLQKADVERQQGMHAEHAHIFRQAKPFEDFPPYLSSLRPWYCGFNLYMAPSLFHSDGEGIVSEFALQCTNMEQSKRELGV